jgi:VWFA-related protein
MKPLAVGFAVTVTAWAVLSAQVAGPLPIGGQRPQGGERDSAPSTPAPVKSAPGEPADDASPIKVNVNVVNVLASVRDKHNALIPNLTKDDFEIYENGQLQTVKYFSRETNLPLTIGLLIDVSRSQERLIDIEQRAGSAFLDAVLKTKDEAFIMSFGADTELLQDLTNSKRALHKGLDNLKPNFGFSGINSGPVPTATSQAGTVLFDCIYLAATDRMANEVGRKAMVVITDGGDEGSKVGVKKAIEYAQKSDAAIYSVYYADTGFRGGGFYIGGGEGYRWLQQMSGETGGHVYEVSRKNPLDKVFDELQEEMRTQYAIGYTPTDPKKDGSYRKIEVRAKNKDLKVEARKGYYAIAKDDQ